MDAHTQIFGIYINYDLNGDTEKRHEQIDFIGRVSCTHLDIVQAIERFSVSWNKVMFIIIIIIKVRPHSKCL